MTLTRPPFSSHLFAAGQPTTQVITRTPDVAFTLAAEDIRSGVNQHMFSYSTVTIVRNGPPVSLQLADLSQKKYVQVVEVNSVPISYAASMLH
jgi:hypothetical protein